MLAVPEHRVRTELSLLRADSARLPDVEEWDNLARNALEANPFSEHWYLVPALAHLADDPVWIAEYRVGGELCGIMPLSLKDGYGRMPVQHIGNWVHYQSFMGSPLIRCGHGEDFWRALLDALDGADWVPGFLSVRLLDADGPVLRDLKAAARPCPIVHHHERAMLESQHSAADYLEANVRGKKRKEWRRLEARLAETGRIAFDILCDPTQLNAWCYEFLALESAGWKGERGAALANTDGTHAFFVEVMHGAQAADRLEFQRLSLDGKPIAMLINFLTPPGSWSFKIAYDETLARYSPGVMIELKNLARVLDDPQIDWMDSCAVEGHPMIDHLWAERRQIVQVSVPLSGFGRRLIYAACRAAETASARLRKF